MTSQDKILMSGDDPIDSINEDWFDFQPHVIDLTEKLIKISNSSSVSCSIIGGWGTGKSSFLLLMDSYILTKKKETKCLPIWFIAWRPGAETNIGNELLYRIYNTVVENATGKKYKYFRKLKKQFEKFQRAMGHRLGITNIVKGIASKVEEVDVAPSEVKGVATLSKYIAERFESSHDIRESFKILSEFLHENNFKVFIFIDEIDRANGKEIFEILSELKAYMNYKHFIIILGYDENYILKCIKEYLPEEINPSDFIEKIISIKKNIPVPTANQLRFLGVNILNDIVPNIKTHRGIISNIVFDICEWNPRKLKRIILSFIQHLPSDEELNREQLISLLYLTAFNDIGLLENINVQGAIRIREESALMETLLNVVKDNNDQSINIIYKSFESYIQGNNFDFDMSNYFGIRRKYRLRVTERTDQSIKEYDWKIPILSILKKLFKDGFTISKNYTTLNKSIKLGKMKSIKPKKIWNKNLRIIRHMNNIIYESEDRYISILIPSVTSSDASRRNMTRIYRTEIKDFIYMAPMLTENKEYMVWLIDDVNALTTSRYKKLKNLIDDISVGLKNKLILVYTPFEGVNPLIDYLISLL